MSHISHNCVSFVIIVSFPVSKVQESMDIQKLKKKMNQKVIVNPTHKEKKKAEIFSIIRHMKHTNISWLAETSWNCMCSFRSQVMLNSRSWKCIFPVMILHSILIHNTKLFMADFTEEKFHYIFSMVLISSLL